MFLYNFSFQIHLQSFIKYIKTLITRKKDYNYTYIFEFLKNAQEKIVLYLYKFLIILKLITHSISILSVILFICFAVLCSLFFYIYIIAVIYFSCNKVFQISRNIMYISSFEDLFIQNKLDASLEEQQKEFNANKKLLSQYEKRVRHIDNLIQHIYEDNISGKITDDRFATLSLNYEKEQKELKEKNNELTIALDKSKQEKIDLTTFIGKVRKYTNIKELTPEIINELIDKILIYQQTKLDGKKYQQIDIYYAGVGIISIPTNEYELEESFQQGIKDIKTA